VKREMDFHEDQNRQRSTDNRLCSCSDTCGAVEEIRGNIMARAHTAQEEG
jgi:hypothetical protein